MVGQLTLQAEQEIIAETKAWLEEKAEQMSAFRRYLDHWGDFANPWQEGRPEA